MNYLLSDDDRAHLNKLIAEAEDHTSAQIVLAAIHRSDNYAEIPWKAFASGTSAAGLAVFLYGILLFPWITGTVILYSVALILSAGVVLASLTLLSPSFARLFLAGSRRETETMQYAESLFLSHELFATTGRRGILVMVSMFEKQIVILADKGVRDKLDGEGMKKIISEMKNTLRHDGIRLAMETGIDQIRMVLGTASNTGKGKNELSDEIIEEEGA